MLTEITLDQALQSILHQDQLEPDELKQFRQRFGKFPIHYAILDYGKDQFEHWRYIRTYKKNRRGEIAIDVRNSQNEILLHTKTFYPNNSYRILTGGVEADEPVLECLERELAEETGLKFDECFLSAVVLYEFRHRNETLSFSSYLFRVSVNKDIPIVQDESERISGFRWADVEQFEKATRHLENLQPERWHDWGRMRAALHRIIQPAEKKL